MSYGRQEYEATRRLAWLDAASRSDFSGSTVGLGAKASYVLRDAAEDAWHIRPYVNLDALWYRQHGYRESGAGVYDQTAAPYSDRSVTAGLGIEAKRELGKSGAYGVWLGYRRILTGEETALTAGFAADPGQSFAVRANRAAKDSFVWGVRGEVELHAGFSLQGALQQ